MVRLRSYRVQGLQGLGVQGLSGRALSSPLARLRCIETQCLEVAIPIHSVGPAKACGRRSRKVLCSFETLRSHQPSTFFKIPKGSEDFLSHHGNCTRGTQMQTDSLSFGYRTVEAQHGLAKH